MRVSLLLSACATFAAAAPAIAVPIQTNGHTDIRFLYDAGSGNASLEYHLDAGAMVDGTPLAVETAYAPGDLITYVPDPSVSRPAGSAWDFTGNAAGEPLWYIPFSQEGDRPWTGISTESVSDADFSNISYELTAFSGPGQMSVADFGPFGNPNIYFQTNNGISGSDVINVPAGTHAHYAWFFTEMGTYTFDIMATGTFTQAAGGGSVSVAETFTFQVVPEPATVVLLVAGFGALCKRRRRSI